MKAKLRLKYVGRFRDTYNFDEKQPVENKIDDEEFKNDENEEKNV